ncbi:PITH domain-containing 1 [Paramuricea clavata]|uniref:PITH domain-containing 1 n=1 Tax=Paramuricea clavata TaxID=317549 RepID=A0A6S7GNN3_PARCT|nr:PITH domain-containing 1 [Paramuricea clavata]
MDKEKEILQKLEQLRVEQLKALKELKKVEKAKKKQRRRTAHGCPSFINIGGNQNSTTTDKNARTPAQDKSHVMGRTSSKSCSRIDGARMKAKFTPNLKGEQESEINEIAFALSSSNKDKSSSIKNAARVNKPEENSIEVEPHKTEGVAQKEVLATRNIRLSKENRFNANEVVSKPTISLDMTPKTSLFAEEKPENYKKGTIIQKEVSSTGSNGLSKDNSKTVSKPGITLNLTPKSRLFGEKETENRPARIPQQKNVGRLTKPLKFSRKARSSLKFPPASTGWRKSEIPNTVFVSGKRQSFGKIKQIEDIAETALGENSVLYENFCEAKESENNTDTKHAECKLQDCGPNKRTSTNTTRSQANDNRVESGEQEPSKPGSKPLNEKLLSTHRNEKLLSTQSTVSTHCQQFHNFSQNIFSQSLFDDVLGDQSSTDDLPDICEPSTTKMGNTQTNTCEVGVAIAPINNKRGQICNGKDEKQNYALTTNGKMKPNLITSSKLKRSACNSSGRRSIATEILPRNAMQLEEDSKEIGKEADHNLYSKTDTSDISPGNTVQEDDPKERKTMNSNIPTGVSEIRKLSSNLPSSSLPQMVNIGDKVEDVKLSTNVLEDAPFQPVENAMPTISSSKKITSAKVAQPATGNNQVSDMGDDCNSRFLLKETDRQLERQENKSSQSINDNMAAEYNKVLEHEGALLEQQTERLQPEFVEDMLTDFPQIDDIFANELGVFDTRPESKTASVESKDRKQTNTVSRELKNLQFIKDKNSFNFDELLLSQPSSPFPQNVPFEGHSSEGVTLIEREICLQHSLNSLGSCNEVRQIKFLSHQADETKLDMIAVCLSRLLVLWRAANSRPSWVVMHKWILGEDEEIVDIEVASVGSCIVLVIGGNFHKALGRVYCVHDKSDCKFDIYEEVSFSDLGETVYGYQDMCLLKNKDSIENVSIIMASACGGKIVLTKWTIDLICFCLEDCKDLPDVIGSEMSSLCLVQGSKCLLLGCVDSDVYLWNYNSCELLCRMTLQICLLTKPVFLSAETNSGIIFLSLLYKEEKKVDLVAINPQTSREACLKTFNMVHMIDDKRNKLLHCCKTGTYVISSFQHGQIFLWNIATDSKTVLLPNFGDVYCISLHPEDSVIAFGTVSGCVYLNVL